MSVNRRKFLSTAGSFSAAGAFSVAGALGTATMASSSLVNAQESKALVIDVHTHMFSEGWMDVARSSSDPDFYLGTGEQEGGLIYRGASMGTIVSTMLDYDSRIAAMDAAGVDIALISLTAPNVYWGTKEESIKAARAINDDFKAAADKNDGRIRWMASLPWQYEEAAIEELKRAKANGAVGICMLTNILGEPLTEEKYKPIWREIEAMDLPVFIHPTKPYVDYIGAEPYGLFNAIGFTNDTSLCFARMINTGFFDEFKSINLIASHGGGSLPYLIARLDRIWEKGMEPEARTQFTPSDYLRRIHFDALVFDDSTLDFLIERVGYDRVLYGSDYPFRISDMEGVLARVDKRPAHERDAIRSGNLLKLFDL